MIRLLDNNPVGQALAIGCGVLVLAAASLAYVWTRPAFSGLPHHEANGEFETPAQALASDIGPISDYREVTERPVFDPERQPVVAVDGEGLDEPGEVADAPEVRLTGVVITPESKFVTLKPVSGEDSLIASEGEMLEGEYFGWSVGEIKPRSVELESREGDSLDLELEVNTRKIAEPPEPPAVAEAGEGEEGLNEAAQAAAEGEEPMSRAEEIRQRIAERREELRRQAREEEESGSRRGSTSAYQSAIRNMINRKKRDDNEGENDSENGKDG